MFSHDVTAAILVSQTMKWRPCWCPKPILWKLNSFLTQTLSFVPINLHRRWPHEWKHSILKYLSYTYSLSMFVANLRLGCYSLFSNPQNQLCLTSPPPPPPQHHHHHTTTAAPQILCKILFSNALMNIQSPQERLLIAGCLRSNWKEKASFCIDILMIGTLCLLK